MNTVDIHQFVYPFQRGRRFKGVFACDRLPAQFSLPAIFIINLSPSTQPGTHWVSVYIDGQGSGFYFDSFGLPPRNVHILRFLRMHTKNFIYNKKQIQHLSSIKCGRFACVFTVHILRNNGPQSFFERFALNLRINDIVVEGFYNYFDVIRKGLCE